MNRDAFFFAYLTGVRSHPDTLLMDLGGSATNCAACTHSKDAHHTRLGISTFCTYCDCPKFLKTEAATYACPLCIEAHPTDEPTDCSCSCGHKIRYVSMGGIWYEEEELMRSSPYV